MWPRRSRSVYGDAWHANALWRGLFALAALIVGVVVLARPAFGNPDRIPAQAPWVKSVAWAGVALGVVGLLLAVLKYSDILLACRPRAEEPHVLRGLRPAVGNLRRRH